VSAAQGSIFARIVAGEIPCQRVFENAHVLAFLDIHPLTDGHTLLVPKQPAARLSDLDPATAAELAQAIPVLVRKIMAATGAPGCNVLINDGEAAGQEVPYVHIHLIPRREGDGLGYRWRAGGRSASELDALAARLATV
jgi:histidine triad (HIT) family protein